MSEGRGSRQGFWLPILIPVGSLVAIGLVLFGVSRILLAVSHTAATIVALVVAAGIVAVAAFVASRPKVTGSSLTTMVGAVAGIVMLAGGGAVLASGGEEHEEVEATVVTIEAPVGAAVDGFSTDALSFPSDAPVVLEFDNQDAGIQHNVAIYDGADASAPVLLNGQTITGVAQADYDVEPLPAGEYFFNCVVHPTTMTGVVTASEGGGGGGGGGEVTVTALNLAFDTDEIDLPADQETALAFVNDDAGIPHNIAIYGDDSLAEMLFQGEVFNGVATETYQVPALPEGEYYFHCDVHPNMNGVVVAGGKGDADGGAGAGGGGPGDEPDAED